MFADISADMNGYPEMPKCKPTNKPLQCNRIIHIFIARQSNTTKRLMCTLKCVLLIANDYITFASIVQQKLNNFLSINPTFSNACNNHFGHFWYTLAGIFFVMLRLLRHARITEAPTILQFKNYHTWVEIKTLKLGKSKDIYVLRKMYFRISIRFWIQRSKEGILWGITCFVSVLFPWAYSAATAYSSTSKKGRN